MLEQMKFLPCVLAIFLLLSCDEKPGSPENTAPEPSSPAVIDTKDLKAAKYQQARGIEKILRTPSYEYDPSRNSQAWSDEEFLQRYEAAITCDMENFLGETYDDYVRQQLGAEQVETDFTNARASVAELVKAAKAAYLAAIQWCEADVKLQTYQDEVPDTDDFRLALRTRLLKELFLLSSNGDTVCYWSSGIQENEEGTAVSMPLPSFEAQIHDRLSLLQQERGMTEANDLISPRLNQQILSNRTFIKDVTYSEDEAQAPVRVAFETAEKAWDSYRAAMVAAHSPIYNQFVGGSGTGQFRFQLEIFMQLSHLQYLNLIQGCAGSASLQEIQPIDFTAFESYEAKD